MDEPTPSESAPISSSSSAPVKPSPLVLVVEDYEDNRELFAQHLDMAGFRTITAENGFEALEKAHAEKPDVIAMDLALPELDGWEATRRLKADPATRGICIIAVSGHAEARYIEKARAAGCDHFLAKPCVPEQLVAEIHECLARRHG